MTSKFRPAPLAPVSWGELLDKITILEIKAIRIADAAARANVDRELALLREVASPVLPQPGLAVLIDGLRRVNLDLWQIEDDIRAKEAAARFDEEFIALARSVYLKNDKRAALKRDINALLGSELVEEKYHPCSSRILQKEAPACAGDGSP